MRSVRLLAVSLALAVAGCGIIQPTLPNRGDPNLTLATIAGIQSDATMPNTDKAGLVRALLGTTNDAAGDRVVNFVLSLQIPARTPIVAPR